MKPRGYDEIQEELRRRKRERWLRILASEPAGHASGRRPRDPEQERLLLKLDRARLARRAAAGELKVSRADPSDEDG